ncbi:hypothetical protein NG798_09200 [Ancylothrix sp. C2]|uniref:hypothetical protein n=1 Tax=Ancylothrix sp. D3o TaxID=2953691 RepID=UPI0021BB4CA0|nr:hypothetical protein [Ancylothrix sp. D3o]MCT7949961.1 hypothetical protein [Ancylothrix sp. D3o]
MVKLQEVLQLAKQLSSVDKMRLIQQIAPDIEQELMVSNNKPRKSLWGLCADLGPAPSAEEIEEMRQEAWANFPREDI